MNIHLIFMHIYEKRFKLDKTFEIFLFEKITELN